MTPSNDDDKRKWQALEREKKVVGEINKKESEIIFINTLYLFMHFT